jgi:hypothetical protein
MEVVRDRGWESVQTMGSLLLEGPQETQAQVCAAEQWALRWGGVSAAG